jgi:hypothetical protein
LSATSTSTARSGKRHTAAAAAVSNRPGADDNLHHVYYVLRHVPAEEFGGEIPERERYTHMGALLVAQEAANAEMERLKGEAPA